MQNLHAFRPQVVMLAALAAAGCRTPNQSTDAAASNVKIVGGAPVAAGSPGDTSAVAILQSPGDTPGYCTGTLVAPNLVVTAAHCLATDDNNGSAPLYVGFQSAAHPAMDLHKVTVAKAHDYYPSVVTVAANYDDGDFSSPVFDIAWLKFEGAPPAGFVPMPILPDLAALTPGTELTLVGYGQTGPDADGGTKLAAATKIHKVIDNFWVRGVILTGPDPSGRGACHGDSGGPAYAKVGDAWFLAGAIQGAGRGYSFLYDVPTGDSCADGATLLVAVPRMRSWLAASAGVTLPGRAPPPFHEFDDTGVEHQTFTDYCNDTSTSFKIWRTAHSLLEWTPTLACAKAAGYYAKQDVLFTGPDIDLAVVESLPTVFGLAVDRASPPNAALMPLLKRVQYLSYSRTDDVATLGSLTQLKHLDVGATFGPNNQFDASGVPIALDWLASLAPNLRELGVRASLTDAKAIAPLTQLTSLTLTYNLKLADVSALAPLTALTNVDLSHTSLTDFSVLKTMPGLRQLNASYDKLTDAKPFVALPLTSLDLSNNKITDASPLAQSTTLQRLALAGNPLAVNKCPLPPAQGTCDLGGAPDRGSH